MAQVRNICCNYKDDKVITPSKSNGVDQEPAITTINGVPVPLPTISKVISQLPYLYPIINLDRRFNKSDFQTFPDIFHSLKVSRMVAVKKLLALLPFLSIAAAASMGIILRSSKINKNFEFFLNLQLLK